MNAEPLLTVTEPLTQALRRIHEARALQAHATQVREETAVTDELLSRLNRLGIGPVTCIGIGLSQEGETIPMQHRPYALARVEGIYLFGWLPAPQVGYNLHVMDDEGNWAPVHGISSLADLINPVHYHPHHSAVNRTIRPPLTE